MVIPTEHMLSALCLLFLPGVTLKPGFIEWLETWLRNNDFLSHGLFTVSWTNKAVCTLNKRRANQWIDRNVSHYAAFI